MRRVRIRPVASKDAVLHPEPNQATTPPTPSLPRSSIPFAYRFLFPPHPRVRATCQMVCKLLHLTKTPIIFFSLLCVGAPSSFPRFRSRLITRRFWTKFPNGPDRDLSGREISDECMGGPDESRWARSIFCFSAPWGTEASEGLRPEA
jgi:hypothetical protein